MIAHVIRRIEVNLADARVFGLCVLNRHFKKRTNNRLMSVKTQDVGPIHIRAGESDIATLRQVFIGGEYDLSHPEHLKDRVQARYRAILGVGSIPVIADIGANIGATAGFVALEMGSAEEAY